MYLDLILFEYRDFGYPSRYSRIMWDLKLPTAEPDLNLSAVNSV